MESRQGFLHLYIGDGKGKTTSAVGMAIRAAGWNWPVLFCQFLKPAESGEQKVLSRLSDSITLFRPSMRHKGFFRDQTPQQREETREDLLEGWSHVEKLAGDGSFRMIVLDEILDVLSLGIIPESRVLDLVRKCPCEWILTGRTAPETLMDMADYITRMEPVRHPFRKGIRARRGIEY